jgi:hypothetical protein
MVLPFSSPLNDQTGWHMDIKDISSRGYPVVATHKYRLLLTQSPEGILAWPPSMPEEIIDCAEVQIIYNNPPVFSQRTPYQILTNRCIIGKGTLIDIWI